MYLKRILCAGFLALTGNGWVSPLSAANPSDSVAWWVDHFGVLEDQRAARAHTVFSRLVRVADIRSHRPPQLVVVSRARQPMAVALPDGTIVITGELIDTCGGGLLLEQNARLAFVLSHELAHLSNDDHWSTAAFGTLGKTDGTPLEIVADLLHHHNREDRRQAKELRADEHGLLTMAMAGYDPRVIVDLDFLDGWTDFSAQTPVTHPTPQTRATYLRKVLSDVASHLDLYRMSLRLYQTGRTMDALVLLEEFAGRFPCGEAHHMIALAHVRLAERTLGLCDPKAVIAFYPPEVLAGEVRTSGAGATRGPEDQCRSEPRYRRHVQAAVDAFAVAERRLSGRSLARVHSSALHLLDGHPAAALGDADRTTFSGPSIAQEAINVRAMSLYLWGKQEHLDTTERALKLLDSVSDPSAMTYYNRGRILEDRGRSAAAAQAYRSFLDQRPPEPWAGHARNVLEVPESGAHRSQGGPRPWIPLGPRTKAQLLKLRSEASSLVEIPKLDGAVLRFGDRLALVLGGSVEIAETPPSAPFEAAAATASYGSPSRSIPHADGSKTLLWSRHGATIQNNKVTSLFVIDP